MGGAWKSRYETTPLSLCVCVCVCVHVSSLVAAQLMFLDVSTPCSFWDAVSYYDNNNNSSCSPVNDQSLLVKDWPPVTKQRVGQNAYTGSARGPPGRSGPSPGSQTASPGCP